MAKPGLVGWMNPHSKTR